MTTLAQWRRRTLAAEERASLSERKVARLSAKVAKLEDQLAEVMSAHEGAHNAFVVADCILRRLAAIHLGEASEAEVRALVQRWIDDHGKRRAKAKPQVAGIAIHISAEELFRRLGIDPGDFDS